MFLRVSSAHMPSPLLRRTPAVLFSLFTSCLPGLGSSSRRMTAFPQINGSGPHYPFEAFSVFTHVMARALPDPLRGLFLKCLSDFVTSITPSGGSGCSE